MLHIGLDVHERLTAVPYAETEAECERRRGEFALRYKKADPKAVATLTRDWERIVTFYSFPKEHWLHLRTTNIVKSPFSAVRLRTDASRRYKRAEGAKAIIWNVLRVAERTWRKLNAPELLPLVAAGASFTDGVRYEAEPDRRRTKPRPEAVAALV
jgi:transposase-like protein